MKILWSLMDYNEPFSGGVERTFHNMITMSDKHENHVWPTSLSNRLALPKNTIKTGTALDNYDLAIIEGNVRVLKNIDLIKSKSKVIIIKIQAISKAVIQELSKKGNFYYFSYVWPNEEILNENRKNKFFVVPPFKNTNFWKKTPTTTTPGNLLIVGRVGKEKHINEFLKSYNLHDFKNKSNLNIVGGSNCEPEKVTLKKTLSESSIKYSWEKEFKPDAFLLEAYNKAEVSIVTSEKETFGHHIIESLLCGTPVMTSYKYFCSSLQWFGKYITQCMSYEDLLNKIEQKSYIDPAQFRSELEQQFGMEANYLKFNKLLETCANNQI